MKEMIITLMGDTWLPIHQVHIKNFLEQDEDAGINKKDGDVGLPESNSQDTSVHHASPLGHNI